MIVAAFVLLFEIPALVEGGRVDDLAGEWLFLGGVWLLGRWVRQRRQRTADLERHAADLEADRSALAREAVADERARIAREMHDAVAHSVSVMVLQAGAAEQVLATAPERARESLVTIQDTGREAIVELRRMLGLLRDPVADASLAPQPSVDRLDALLEQVRAAGLPVELTVEGEPRRLPPGIDRSAYRIVQEGLTNALKHAGPAHASVRLRYGERALELEVLDDGRGPAGASGGGFGLLGMRERAALYGGVLAARERPGGGYALQRPPAARAGGLVIRVLIADDEALVRGGLRMILEAQPDIEIAGRGRRRARRPRARGAQSSRRRPDGHPHADPRRARGHAPAARQRSARAARAHPHHVRPRRVRLRGPARRAPAASCSRAPARRSSSPPSAPPSPATRCSHPRSPGGSSSPTSAGHRPGPTRRASSSR